MNLTVDGGNFANLVAHHDSQQVPNILRSEISETAACVGSQVKTDSGTTGLIARDLCVAHVAASNYGRSRDYVKCFASAAVRSTCARQNHLVYHASASGRSFRFRSIRP